MQVQSFFQLHKPILSPKAPVYVPLSWNDSARTELEKDHSIISAPHIEIFHVILFNGAYDTIIEANTSFCIEKLSETVQSNKVNNTYDWVIRTCYVSNILVPIQKISLVHQVISKHKFIHEHSKIGKFNFLHQSATVHNCISVEAVNISVDVFGEANNVSY
jgi:hypothetical protein